MDVNEQQRKHEEMEEKQRQEEDEEESQEIEAGSWPFTRTCEFLAFSLFSSRWEDRHGAAVALREILRYQAECANIFIETFDTTTGGDDAKSPNSTLVKVQPGTAEAQMRANFSWLEDISVRLLCVLALDRFGDFVGDGVVAPRQHEPYAEFVGRDPGRLRIGFLDHAIRANTEIDPEVAEAVLYRCAGQG